MGYVTFPLPLIFQELEVADYYGNVSVYPYGEYSTGLYVREDPETVSRPKPLDLKAPSSLTARSARTYRRSSGTFDMYYKGAGGSYVWFKNMLVTNYAPCYQPLPSPSPNWQQALWTAVKDQKLNLAQDLAEYKQVQKMFVNNATTVVKALRDFKRGKFSNGLKTLGLTPKQTRSSVSNRWLEYQYGIRPLMQSLYGAAEELNVALQRPRVRKLSVSKTEHDRKVIVTDLGPPTGKCTMDASWDVRCRVNAWLLQDSLAACRLGITNPVDLVWELIPYSFVVDWFIPIGDWLNSLDAVVGLNGVWGTVTTKAKSIVTQSLGANLIERTYSRQVFTSLPGLPPPQYKASLGVGQIANALALLSQLKR